MQSRGCLRARNVNNPEPIGKSFLSKGAADKAARVASRWAGRNANDLSTMANRGIASSGRERS